MNVWGVRTKDAMASLEKCNVKVEERVVDELNNWQIYSLELIIQTNLAINDKKLRIHVELDVAQFKIQVLENMLENKKGEFTFFFFSLSICNSLMFVTRFHA